ncbi:hypothetical protein AC249_AIPGENE21916, partial [Exaiptasia diaphana]
RTRRQQGRGPGWEPGRSGVRGPVPDQQGSRREAVAVSQTRSLIIAAAVCLVLWIALGVWLSSALDAATRAEARVELLEGQLEGLRASETILRDSLVTVQEEAQAAIDSAEVVIEVTDTVLVAQMDTLEVLVQDTAALRIIEQRDSVHAVRLAAKDEVIEAQAEEIRVLTLLDESQKAIIANLEAQNAEHEDANTALRGAVRSLQRRQRLMKGVVVVAGGVALYRAFSGST